jgi:hypothetical protein
VGGVAAATARADFPSLYVNYRTEDCTFKLTNDAGAAVSTVAPGTYQIVIATSDPYGVFGQSPPSLYACQGFVKFRLTGPGVNVYTTLDYGDASYELDTATFRPGATYTMQDDTNVAGTKRSITVTTPGAAAAPSATGKAAGTQVRGSLEVVVARSGAIRLTRKGKPIGALRAGRYTFSVRDLSEQHGFSLQAAKGKPQTITNAAFVGWRDLTVQLAPGRWSFFTPGGAKSTFLVVG